MKKYSMAVLFALVGLAALIALQVSLPSAAFAAPDCDTSKWGRLIEATKNMSDDNPRKMRFQGVLSNYGCWNSVQGWTDGTVSRAAPPKRTVKQAAPPKQTVKQAAPPKQTVKQAAPPKRTVKRAAAPKQTVKRAAASGCDTSKWGWLIRYTKNLSDDNPRKMRNQGILGNYGCWHSIHGWTDGTVSSAAPPKQTVKRAAPVAANPAAAPMQNPTANTCQLARMYNRALNCHGCRGDDGAAYYLECNTKSSGSCYMYEWDERGLKYKDYRTITRNYLGTCMFDKNTRTCTMQ